MIKRNTASMLILIISWLSAWLINETTIIVHPAFYWSYGTIFMCISGLLQGRISHDRT
jgi:hypothetical protein